MFAVIKTGGKQYRVSEGNTIKVEKLPVEAGKTITLDKVLLLSNEEQVSVGHPYIDGAKVKATVVSHGRHAKISILKFRRRKHHMKRAGHRQDFTQIKIDKITH